jgi:hypothetical protein
VGIKKATIEHDRLLYRPVCRIKNQVAVASVKARVIWSSASLVSNNLALTLLIAGCIRSAAMIGPLRVLGFLSAFKQINTALFSDCSSVDVQSVCQKLRILGNRLA